LNPHSPVCAKLTDFGTCRNISERNLSSKELTQGIGTPTYMAPECLQSSNNYSYPIDVYAFGIVLYETYIEKGAYTDDRFTQPWMIPQFVIEGNRLDKPNGIPENYWDLTTKCWSQNAEDRPTFNDVLSIIESWGEDIRYALNAEGTKKMNGSDVSSSSASVPSSAQEPSLASDSESSTSRSSISNKVSSNEQSSEERKGTEPVSEEAVNNDQGNPMEETPNTNQENPIEETPNTNQEDPIEETPNTNQENPIEETPNDIRQESPSSSSSSSSSSSDSSD